MDYLFFPKERMWREEGEEERVKEPKKELSGARIELAIYRLHDMLYETVALK